MYLKVRIVSIDNQKYVFILKIGDEIYSKRNNDNKFLNFSFYQHLKSIINN